jgi:hypothetical protein
LDFEFVRFWMVTAAYRPVYRNRWPAVRWTGSVSKTVLGPTPSTSGYDHVLVHLVTNSSFIFDNGSLPSAAWRAQLEEEFPLVLSKAKPSVKALLSSLLSSL